MLLLVFLAHLLMFAPFGKVFGEGHEKDRVTYESFKMLRDFDEKILQPLTEICPEKKYGGKLEDMNSTDQPTWFLCVPVVSLDKSYINFLTEIRREKLHNLKFEEDKRTIKDWFKKFITKIFINKEKRQEHEQEKWNKLNTLYQTYIDKFREGILLMYDYSLNIIGKQDVRKFQEETLEAMGKTDLKKLFISKVADLKKEREPKKLAKVMNEMRAIALAFDERYKHDTDELEFLRQLLVANLSFCAKQLQTGMYQGLADKWPI